MLELESNDDGRLGCRGVGGSGFEASTGGVLLTKFRKDGTVCSIPLRDEVEEFEESYLSIEGRFSVPVDCGLGILQPCAFL